MLYEVITMRFLEQRIVDPNLLRLIRRFLKAGQDTMIGDPNSTCDEKQRSVIMSMSDVSVPAEFVMSNVTLIVDGNVDIASATSSGVTSTSYNFV